MKSNILKQAFDRLNQERKNRNLRPVSLNDLAECAADPVAYPGEATKISKATVHALMHGTYKAATAPALVKRLLAVITIKLADLGIVDRAKARKARSKPVMPRQYAVNRQGYLEHKGRTYYLGRHFAGLPCTVKIESEGRGLVPCVRVHGPAGQRLAYAIDPRGNQLGYEVA